MSVRLRTALRRAVPALALVVVAPVLGLVASAPAAQAAPAVAACDPAGPSARDAQLAAELNPRLQTKMRGYLNAYRISCARVVVDAVRARPGMNQHAANIAVATIIVESVMDNLTVAVDKDSLGLFQQRPSWGWCAPAQCIDPVFATNSFLSGIERTFPNGSWNGRSIGDVAADVQDSAFPARYGVEAGDAVKIVAALWNAAPPAAMPYESGRVVSGRSADGRLEAFAAGADGVWHAWQTRVNGEWSRWENLGGPRDAELAIVPNPDGRLEVFALDGEVLQHAWQTAPNAGFSGWATFGTGGHDLAAGAGADGRVEVFASNPDGVFHRWQTGPGLWSEWEGTAPGDNGPANATLEMAISPDGRLEVFALSAERFGHLFQTAASGRWGAWEAFGTGGHDLTVDVNADGRIEVAASNPNGVFRTWQTGRDTWSEWRGTGGLPNAQLASERTPDGRIELYAINGDSAQHAWQTGLNGEFSGWETFGTGGTEIQATKNADGRIEVIATSTSGVFHKWQTGFTTWSGWAWLNDAGPGLA